MSDSKELRSVVSRRGHVTIPKTLRERFGIEPGHVVEFAEVEGALVVRRVVEIPPDPELDAAHTDKSTDELLLELQRLRR